MRTPEKRKRLVALILGAGLVIALVLAAATSGFGGPSLPDGDVAYVEEAPDGDITQEEFDAALEQAAARQQIRETPEPGTPEYDLVKESAMADLLLAVWVRGEAEELGIEVTDREIDAERETIIQEQFGDEKAFAKFLEDSGLSEEEARDRIQLQLLSNRIQEQVVETEPEVPQDEIQSFYEENIAQFTTPENRDVRTILTQNEAKAQEAFEALSRDDSPGSWKRVAKEFSTDEATSGVGGLRQALVEGQSDPELDAAVFSAAEGELIGPIETPSGFYVFQVDTVTPEATQELDEQTTEQIRQTLVSQIQQEQAMAFQSDFVAKWRERTVCADDYIIERCGNAPPPPDACVGDDEGEEQPPDPQTGEVPENAGCPAFVPSTRPVPPSQAGQPGATGLPQGPITGPAAAPVQGQPLGVPGAPTGAPVPGQPAPAPAP